MPDRFAPTIPPFSRCPGCGGVSMRVAPAGPVTCAHCGRDRGVAVPLVMVGHRGRLAAVRVEPWGPHGFQGWEVGTLLPTGLGPSREEAVEDWKRRMQHHG